MRKLIALLSLIPTLCFAQYVPLTFDHVDATLIKIGP